MEKFIQKHAKRREILDSKQKQTNQETLFYNTKLNEPVAGRDSHLRVAGTRRRGS